MDMKEAQPSKDASLFVLDNVGVVFIEARQELYELNATATYIWCRLEEGFKPSEITRDLAMIFGFAASDAERHVCDSLGQWHALGLLNGSEPTNPAAADARANDSRSGFLAPGDATSPSDLPFSRSYHILGHNYRLGFATLEIEAKVHPILVHLETKKIEDRTQLTEISICGEPGDYVIAKGGRTKYRCSRLDEIAPYVYSAVFLDALARSDHGVGIHAGGVSDGERALLLPGIGGSGKTSLTAALVRMGFRYLSDDLVLLKGQASSIEGLPVSLCIKESGVDLLASYFPEVKDLAFHVRPDGKRVCYLPPPVTVEPKDPVSPPRLAWLVFPSYTPDASTRLEAISPGQALRQLALHCKIMSRITREEVSILVSQLRSATCFTLCFSSLDEGLAQLMHLWMEAKE